MFYSPQEQNGFNPTIEEDPNDERHSHSASQRPASILDNDDHTSDNGHNGGLASGTNHDLSGTMSANNTPNNLSNNANLNNTSATRGAQVS